MPRLYSWKVISYLTAALILDLCVIPAFFTGHGRPIFLYLAVLYSAFEWNWFKTVRIALAAGLIRDLTGTEPLGVEVIALIMASFVVGFLLQKMDRHSNLMRAVLSGIYVFAVLMLTFILAVFLGETHPLSATIFTQAFYSGVWTGVLAPGFFYLSKHWLDGELSTRKQYELFS